MLNEFEIHKFFLKKKLNRLEDFFQEKLCSIKNFCKILIKLNN
jgi:hypothetical protein